MLSPLLDRVTSDDQQIKQEIGKLDLKVKEQLDPGKRISLEAEQNKRPELLVAVALNADKSEEEKAIALNTLKLHDKKLNSIWQRLPVSQRRARQDHEEDRRSLEEYRNAYQSDRGCGQKESSRRLASVSGKHGAPRQ